VTPFCAYAKLPAAVAPVTAATVVPTISFALNPSRDSAGTNTTAPPKPVIADTAPAKEPDAAENAARDAGVDNDSTAAVAATFAAILVLLSSFSLSNVYTVFKNRAAAAAAHLYVCFERARVVCEIRSRWRDSRGRRWNKKIALSLFLSLFKEEEEEEKRTDACSHSLSVCVFLCVRVFDLFHVHSLSCRARVISLSISYEERRRKCDKRRKKKPLSLSLNLRNKNGKKALRRRRALVISCCNDAEMQ
jgi:hypothetical protein